MENESAEQLSIIAEARSAVADRLITPWWYHPILGLLLAGYLVAFGLGNTLVRLIAVLVFGAGCAALVSAYRRLTGVWVSGLEAGSAGRWAKLLGATALVAMLAAWYIGYGTDLTWPVWVLAAVLFVTTVILGRRFDTALRAQLRTAG